MGSCALASTENACFGLKSRRLNGYSRFYAVSCLSVCAKHDFGRSMDAKRRSCGDGVFRIPLSPLSTLPRRHLDGRNPSTTAPIHLYALHLSQVSLRLYYATDLSPSPRCCKHLRCAPPLHIAPGSRPRMIDHGPHQEEDGRQDHRGRYQIHLRHLFRRHHCHCRCSFLL